MYWMEMEVLPAFTIYGVLLLERATGDKKAQGLLKWITVIWKIESDPNYSDNQYKYLM
jgi:hypothetical protein